MRTLARYRTRLPIMVVAMMLIAAACSGGADTSAPTESTVAPGNDAQPSTPTASDAPAPPAGPAAALDPAVLERTKSVDEVTTADGGQVMVAIECDAQTGDDLLHAGAMGLTAGIYTGTVDPPIGGSVKFQVGSDGNGSTARQSTLDQSTYTVTFADIDGGIELTLAGCTE